MYFMDLNADLSWYTSKHYVSIALLAKVSLRVEREAGADRGMIALLSRYPENVTEIGFTLILIHYPDGVRVGCNR
jgi:hypothetical protein